VLTETYADELGAVGRAAGLDRVGVASAEPFALTRRLLEERRAAGLAGSMQFTYRNPARSTDPAATLPGVRSLVVGARRYDRDEPPVGDADRPTGRVARYATGDTYGELRAGLEAIASRLRADGWAARVVSDDNALVDRAAAHRAGLGWFGKNANVLVPGIGSWVVLGSVLTDAPLPPAATVVPDGCGGCRRCLDGCPTGAIVAPGVVDARRCLAWLVQAEGVFPVEHRVALGDRIYGCDDCQEVCPPSRRPVRADPADPGPPRPTDAADDGPGARVDLLDVLAADDATLLARYGRWYIPRREPRYLRRNALVALANAGPSAGREVRAAVERALADPDPLVRAHAVWAARRLGLEPLPAGVRADPDPLVRAEVERPEASVHPPVDGPPAAGPAASGPVTLPDPVVGSRR
jgi:epoxyqueuosine reductase